MLSGTRLVAVTVGVAATVAVTLTLGVAVTVGDAAVDAQPAIGLMQMTIGTMEVTVVTTMPTMGRVMTSSPNPGPGSFVHSQSPTGPPVERTTRPYGDRGIAVPRTRHFAMRSHSQLIGW